MRNGERMPSALKGYVVIVVASCLAYGAGCSRRDAKPYELYEERALRLMDGDDGLLIMWEWYRPEAPSRRLVIEYIRVRPGIYVMCVAGIGDDGESVARSCQFIECPPPPLLCERASPSPPDPNSLVGPPPWTTTADSGYETWEAPNPQLAEEIIEQLAQLSSPEWTHLIVRESISVWPKSDQVILHEYLQNPEFVALLEKFADGADLKGILTSIHSYGKELRPLFGDSWTEIDVTSWLLYQLWGQAQSEIELCLP